MVSEIFDRPTIASLLWVLGGFLSLVTRLTNFMLVRYQSFTIDKSMLKKVFSFEKMPEDKRRTSSGIDFKRSEISAVNPKVQDLEDTIKGR